MLKVGIIIGSTRPGRKAEAVAHCVRHRCETELCIVRLIAGNVSPRSQSTGSTVVYSGVPRAKPESLMT